ncbi:MFS transporter, partial [Spongiactinospora gelatinilytica]
PAGRVQRPTEFDHGVAVLVASAISSVFWRAILFAALVPLLAIFVREVPLRGAPAAAADAEPAKAAPH